MHALRPLLVFAVLALTAVMTFAAAADDWVAVKLRGGVFVFVNDNWVQLQRGDVVSDDRVIRTQPSGRVTFQRGQETIDLGPSTQIQIFDKSGRRFTTVNQFYGKVTVEADVQNVQHFGVRTPYLAAVVKGTKFTVLSDDDSSAVSVQRGHVAVEDFSTNQSVLLSAGQSVDSTDFVVTGASGVPFVSSVPDHSFADLGGGKSSLFTGENDEDPLATLFGGSGGGGGGVDVSLDLGDLSGVDVSLGGGGGIDVDLNAGGATLLSVDAGGGNGVTVTTPLGALGISLGGLL